jgi:hypothetical protein
VTVVVTGSRDWKDAERVKTRIKALPHGTLLVHGGARGVDTIAGKAAKAHCTVRVVHADWETYGKAAGPIRNERMLREYKPDLAIAFIRNNSRGATHCANRAMKLGIKVELHRESGS